MRNKKFTVLAAVIMVFIFAQSALPSELSSEESGVIVDLIMRVIEGILPYGREAIVFAVRKGAHFMEYLILGAVLVPAVKEWSEASRLSGGGEDLPGGGEDLPGGGEDLPGGGADLPEAAPGLLMAGGAPAAWLIGTAYAVTDEFHQSFVPGRSCEFRDIVIDSCGVLTGVLAALLAGWIRAQREKERR